MKDILFNSHDVVLMLAIGLSLILAANALCAKHLERAGRVLLAAFFLLHALVGIDTLLFWGESVKYAAFTVAPWLPMLFAFASFAVGPLLYWFFRSVLEPQKTLRARNHLHLLPALATPFYLYWACFRHPLEHQADLVLDLSIFSEVDTYFLLFLTLKKLVPVIYGVMCINLVLRKRPALAQCTTVLQRLPHLYVGFPILWLWVLFTHVLGQWLPLSISDPMGIFSNYLSFALALALLLRITATPLTANPPEPLTPTAPLLSEDDKLLKEASARSSTDPELARLSQRISNFVEKEKPYLNSQLTLDRFADQLQLPTRQVSTIINSCFRQNFNGYINGFRVEEARQLLHNPAYQELTVMEIAQRAGFSSKATFNRLFKSLMGTPPHVYRQQLSPKTASDQFHKADAT